MVFNLFLIFVYNLMSLAVAEFGMEAAIELNATCGNRLPLDGAEIHFVSNDVDISLYATNGDCYHCSKTFISGTQLDEECSILWVPHGWHLYFISHSSGLVVASKEYSFGEHGRYEIQYASNDSIDVTVIEKEAPIDSIKPIWILVATIISVTILSYLIPKLLSVLELEPLIWGTLGYEVKSEKTMPDIGENSLKYAEINIRESPYETGAVPLLSSEGKENEMKRINAEVETKIKNDKAENAKQRLCSLDTFRGIALSIMVFVNYGAGGYWFFDHAPWNGLTIADLMFPWFMFMMGVSMALSYASLAKKNTPMSALWYKAIRRSLLLWGIGMFLNNGYQFNYWRLPGVLQYFALSNLVTAGTVLICMPTSNRMLEEIREAERVEREKSNNWSINASDRSLLLRVFGDEDGMMPSLVLSCYRYEWIIQVCIVVVYMSVALGAKAPGCPAGYEGPGGISNNSDQPDCTGGIHRYFDMKLFGIDHIYLYPTCQRLYGCIAYDPEGALGGLTACTLTYLGLMTGRVLIHFKNHSDRLKRWCVWSVILMLLAGILCGFSQNEGLMPINKNLWSTSFCFVSAGTGILGLGVCYILIDMYHLWSGAPFRYLGMNSILIYCASDVFADYFPFSYSTNTTSHAHLLQMNVIGVSCWFVVAYWCYHKKIFLKV